MQASLRPFFSMLLIFWSVLLIAAAVYSHRRAIPYAVTLVVLPAFLVEASLYLASGLASTRKRFERSAPKLILALTLTASAVLPFCVYTVAIGQFRWQSLELLTVLATIASFWYVILPHKRPIDILYLVFMAGVVMSKVFVSIYPTPIKGLHLEILGQVMWIRLGIVTLLSFRRAKGPNFAFLPRLLDWKIGILHFLAFIPIGVALAIVLRFARYQPPAMVWWETAGFALLVFFGILWIQALGEEFFFRGVLQHTIAQWRHSEWVAIVITAICFGLAHLWFRRFPNWRFALLACIAGLFYGHAYARAGSVRASMVTHALVVTAWRVWFR